MNFNNNDHGLSEVIGFILILALIIGAISIWMTYVVPAEGRELEISHMDYVGDWFLNYKIAADSLWINDETGVTDSTSLILGSKGGNTQTSGLFLPMMQPIGSSGVLAINNTQDTISVRTSNAQTYPIPLPLSSLTYQSNNKYWIQQQYYYQMGGIFLSQDINGATGVTNIVYPLLSVYNISNPGVTNTLKVVIAPVQLNGGGTVAGEGNARVNFRLQEQPDYVVVEVPPLTWVNISVNVKDSTTALMWRNLFAETIRRENIAPGWVNTGYYSVPSTNRGVAFINITPPSGGTVNLVMKKADFYVSLNTIA